MPVHNLELDGVCKNVAGHTSLRDIFEDYRGLRNLHQLTIDINLLSHIDDEDLEPSIAAQRTMVKITDRRGYVDHVGANHDLLLGMRDQHVAMINDMISRINKSLLLRLFCRV